MKHALFATALAIGLCQPAIAQDAAPATAATDTALTTKSGPLPAPAPGKGLVVFFRPGTMIGAAMGCTVHEGEAEIARLGSGKYYTVAADPGTHHYFTEGEAKDKLDLEVEADETYFVKCSIGMGVMSGRANLAPADRTVFASKAKGLTMWKGPSAK